MCSAWDINITYQISTLHSTVSKCEFLCLFFQRRRPDLITLYFHEPDYTAHRKGPDANQVRWHLFSPCTASSQAFQANAFWWRILDERPLGFARTTRPETQRPRKIMRPSDPPPPGGGYSLIRAEWGCAASLGMFFGIFVLNRVSILSIFVLNRLSF